MTIKKFVVFLCFIAVFIAPSPAWGQTSQPNILWIIGDDWGAHAGSYGTAALSTPNIDSIAADGVRFTNMYVTAPVCSAMRSALITGMYQTSIGAHHHRTRTKSPLPAGVDPITQYFKDAGYWTGNGNWNMSSGGKTDYNFSGGAGYDGRNWNQRPADTPFFQQVQIFSPHRNFKGENTDPNRVNNLDLPDYYPDHALARTDYANYLADVENFDDGVGLILDRLEADGLADNTIVMVFGDHGAPHVRDKQWLYDGGINIPLLIRDPTGTLVPTGSAGSTDSRMLSHIDISATSLSLAGATIPSHVQGEDFSAPGYTGRDAVFAAKDRLDGVVDRVRSVQVGDLKLIRNFNPGTPYMTGEVMESAYKHNSYPMHVLMKVMNGRGLLSEGQARFLTDSRPEYELYDLSADPNEYNNLADDPAYAASLADLQSRLDQWMIDTGDMGGNFDPDAVSEYNSMVNNLNNTKSNRVAPDATDYEMLEWWSNDYGVPINLPESTPQADQIRLPNKSWDNTSLNNGQWNVNTPQGWTEAFSTVVQNMTASQMADQSHDGANVLILNSDNGRTRWAMDDNWGNRVEFGEALAWEIILDLWVGRRSDSQGVDPGVLEVSLQNAAGDKVLSQLFDLNGAVAQGTWENQVFSFNVTTDAIAAAGLGEQLYLAVENVVTGTANNKDARVLLDDMVLTVNAPIRGDFDLSGTIDADDINDLFARDGEVIPLVSLYDLVQDNVINATPNTADSDLDVLIQELLETAYGDTNLDQQVGPSDLTNLKLSWLASNSGWVGGDFNGDGTTGPADLTTLKLNWLFDNTGGGGSGIPEPSGLVLLMFAGLGLSARRGGS